MPFLRGIEEYLLFYGSLCLRVCLCRMESDLRLRGIHSNRIESIQKQFVLFALRNVRWRDRHRLPKYVERCKLISPLTLRRRRLNACAMFVFDLLSNKIDSPVLFSHLTKQHI